MTAQTIAPVSMGLTEATTAATPTPPMVAGGTDTAPPPRRRDERGRLLPVPVEERLWSRVIAAEGSCIAWTGVVDRHGYGRIWVVSREVMVHRLAYELAVGPIPEGLEVDHLCFNRRCVNPHHLEPVIGAENTRRSRERRGLDVRCPHGHLRSEHGRRDSHGWWWCRECKRRARYARRKADRVGADLRPSYPAVGAEGAGALKIRTGPLSPKPRPTSAAAAAQQLTLFDLPVEEVVRRERVNQR